MRTFFAQRAARQKDKHELEVKELELEKQRLQAELDLMRKQADAKIDGETLGKVPELLKLVFEQAGVSIAPQFQVLIKRFEELIVENKRHNQLLESSTHQRNVEQRELININKAGFNDLGIRINDKLEEMVKRVDGMKDQVIQDLGKQIQNMVDDLKMDIKGLPADTAKALEEKILPALEQHKKDIDAKLEILLEEIRAQTKPTEPPAEPPPA